MRFQSRIPYLAAALALALTFALSPAHAVPYRTTLNWQQVNDLTLKYAVDAINGGESPTAALQAIQRQAGGS